MKGALLIAGAVLLIALACRASVGGGSEAGSRFAKRTVVVGGTSYPYQVFVPPGLVAGPRPPVILFLHGSGERGTDGERQTRVGLGPAVRKRAETFPALVVFPQAPPDTLWSGPPAQAAIQALDGALEEFRGDPDRVYLTGVSMGGYGTFELALAYPSRFAALVPVCGGLLPPPRHPGLRVAAIPAGESDPYTYVASRLTALPVWLFHGEDDGSVPVTESRQLAAALEKAGAPVRYTEYPGVGHGSWDPAYAEPGLWEWLFGERRKR